MNTHRIIVNERARYVWACRSMFRGLFNLELTYIHTDILTFIHTMYACMHTAFTSTDARDVGDLS